MDQAEQLRNIIKRQNQPDGMSRVITVTSGKGGVGKSNVSVNLAINLSRQGKRVVILDADFGLANVEVMLGIRPKYNMADLMFRGRELQDIITKGPENIGFISGGSGIQELTNVTKSQITYLTQKLYELDSLADIIIIDTGAGITDSVLEFVTASSEVLLVATPEPTSITDAYALLKILNRKLEFSSNQTAIKMLANRVDSKEAGKQLYTKLNLVVERFLTIKMEFLGSIPQDSNVTRAVMQQKPYSILYPNAPSSRAVYEIANILCDNVSEKTQPSVGIAGLFSNLLRIKSKR
ncbi:site-determining protein [Anaerocolumna cellulosilytica]|uniref:Site-determining protein n=1 Tax=Anaerocolumna cellulosilytica TaxID=433286 RepID=A0A6S6QZL1_9FIRM|nr:MinD/ParA family protein [Anaerocolumna cellulosilytica]MBB5197012.1 flagellar biosynthesis protein FlhG [Anaerocolumna cellulosilytica]BCJ95226.1 site-determining protein [Anaerocolumna cellulosilytica]